MTNTGWFRALAAAFVAALILLPTCAPAAAPKVARADAPRVHAAGAPRVHAAGAADPADPRIVALATQLAHDPAQMFAYVRDQVGIEIYAGSLRGARGTLAGKAGNALDRASLLVALLRASGYTARYRQGTLADADAQALVAAMFPNPLRIIGCVNPNPIPFPDVTQDATLVALAKPHTWVEYKPTPAAAFVALDTAFRAATPGQTFAPAGSTFDEVPDALQHKIRLHLDVETYNQAAAIYGFGLGTQTVLDRTYNAVDLVDHPLTVGHFVASTTPPGLAISATTNTYSPWIVVGDPDVDPRDYQVDRGSDYSELITNFPLGSTVLTGVFLNLDVIDPADPAHPKTQSRTLADRIGYAARQNGGSINLDPAALQTPPLSPLDLTTINVSPSRQPRDGFQGRHDRIGALQSDMAAIAPAVAALPPDSQQTPDELALTERAIMLNRAASIELMEIATTALAGAADVMQERTAALYLVKSYIASPRITIARAEVAFGPPASIRYTLDLRKNDLAVRALPGISLRNAWHYERARGFNESVLEGQILQGVTGVPAVTFASLMTATTDPLAFLPLTPANAADLDGLALSAEATARMGAALAAGRVLIAPRAPIDVGGTPVTAWMESDPATGYTISTFEDGTHGAIVEYATIYAQRFGSQNDKNAVSAKLIGYISGFGVTAFAFSASILAAVVDGNDFDDVAKNTKELLEHAFREFVVFTSTTATTFTSFSTLDEELRELGEKSKTFGAFNNVYALVSGLIDGIETWKNVIQAAAGDPVMPSILTAPPTPPLPATVAPGPTPGVAVTVAPDPRYYYPYYGAQLPVLWTAQVRNTGPVTDTFRLLSNGADYPFALQSPGPALTLPPGVTGEISVCLIPQAALPPPGAPKVFDLTVQSTTNPSVQTTAHGTFAMPAAPALSLRIAPGAATTTAGASIAATVTLDSLGNAPADVTLTAQVAPGLTVTGLPPSAALAAGESRTFPVSFQVGAGVPSGAHLSALIAGDFGAIDPAFDTFVANVTSALTTCTNRAADSANALSRFALAGSLARLAAAADALAAAPADPAALQSVLLELDYLTNVQFNAPYLASFVAPVAALRTTLAGAAPGAIPALLAQIDAALCDVGGALNAADTNNFRLGIAPSVATNLPTQPVSVDVDIFNDASVPRVFDVAVGAVPAGVTATLNVTTVTVPVGNRTNGFAAPPLTVTFVNADGSARAFAYTVIATPRDRPDAAKTATGQLVLRPDVMRIVDLVPTPAYGNAGTAFSVATRLMNSINAPRDVYVNWDVVDKANHVVRGGLDGPVTVNSGDGVVVAPPFGFDSTGLADGTYTVNAWLTDAAKCCDVIPGATGSVGVLVGQPFSALLSASPTNVPPGDATVAMTLALAHDSLPTPEISLRSAIALPAATRAIVQAGAYLYACQTDRVSIVDTTNPDALAIVGTFAMDILANGYGIVGCTISAGKLIVGYSLDSPSSFDNVKFDTYDIAGAHATAPVRLTSAPLDIGKRFGGGILTSGTTGYAPTSVEIYNPFSKFIFEEHGNLLKLDLTDPAAPTVVGELFHHFGAGDANDPVYGGPNAFNGALLIGTQMLIATTTATAGDYSTAVGRIDVVDTAQLDTNCPGASNPCLTAHVDIPQAKSLFGLARQGNAGIAVGDTYGLYDGVTGFNGNLTISALDLTDPAHPVVQSTLVTALLDNLPNVCNRSFDAGGSSVAALTSNFYAVGAFSTASCSWVMAIVDANDPAHLRVIPYDVTDVLGTTLLDGNLFYALTRTGILVYDYATLTGPAITARVDIPKGTGVTVVPGSFNLPPTAIDTSAADHDAYTWQQPSLATITWQQSLAGMQPGEGRTVAQGGRVDFTLPTLGSGSLPINGVVVTSDQTMSIAPASRVAGLGVATSYTVTLRNPTNAPVTYALTVDGLAPAWVKSLDTPVTVPAHGQADSALVVQSGLADLGIGYLFTVTGATGSWTTSVQGTLFVNGFDRNLGPDNTPFIYATTVTPTPNPVTTGRGQTALVHLATHNTGDNSQTYEWFGGVLPSGWSVAYDRANVVVPADASADFVASVRVPPGAAPGDYDVALDLYSSAAFYVGATHVTVHVLGQGVALAVSPPTGAPATTFVATVTNTGIAQDTYDLSLLGALGGVATLASPSVTLAAGAAAGVNVTLGNVGYLPAGGASFDVQAISRTDAAARAKATAQVTLPGAKGVALAGLPASITVPSVPATRAFSLQVTNAGNVEDAYALSIAATTGAITASLQDIGGANVGTLSPVRLPGLSTGLAALQATLNSGKQGTITVQAISLSDGSLLATTTLTLVNAAVPVVTPVPSALDFGDQAVATPSAAKTVVVTNSGSAPFAIGTIAFTGTAAADYGLAGGAQACVAGGSIAAGGGSCTLYVRFTPGAAGTRAATVTLTDSTAAVAAGVALTGNGVAPVCFSGPLPTGGTGTACIANAPPACRFQTASFVPTSEVAPPPPGVALPFGLFRFVAVGCGAAVTLSIAYPAPVAAGAGYYKYGPEANVQAAHWYRLPATVRGNTITVTLVDGGAGDDDLAADGTITDPGGAGVAGSTAIPALDAAWLAALAALLAAVAAVGLRRRR